MPIPTTVWLDILRFQSSILCLLKIGIHEFLVCTGELWSEQFVLQYIFYKTCKCMCNQQKFSSSQFSSHRVHTTYVDHLHMHVRTYNTYMHFEACTNVIQAYYLIELLRHRAIECHVLDNVGPLSLIWRNDSYLFRLHPALHQPCNHLLHISSLSTTNTQQT